MVKEENTEYYKVLKLSKDRKLKTLYSLIIKKIPKQVTWATITLHKDHLTDYTMYNRNSKKVISDSHVTLLEKFGEMEVAFACSNIDYGEYYFDIYLEEEKNSES